MANRSAGTNRQKSKCIRPGTELTREDAVRLIQTYVHHYNTVRLHSAIVYVTPHAMLAGRQAASMIAASAVLLLLGWIVLQQFRHGLVQGFHILFLVGTGVECLGCATCPY